MAKPARVRQIDVTRMVRGVLAGGATIQRVEVDEVGRVAIVVGDDEPAKAATSDDLDRELAEFNASHGNN
jgi:hypothetical protein